MDWKDILDYNPDTGGLTWKWRPQEHFATHRGWKTYLSRRLNTSAGWKTYRDDGSPKAISVKLTEGKSWKAHRIIWEMVNGPIPEGMLVDHKDRDPFNNRISNLRLATRSQNNSNCKRRKSNKSGYHGVTWCEDLMKWHPRLKVNGKVILLGYFDDVKDAAAAWEEGARIHLGEFRPFNPNG